GAQPLHPCEADSIIVSITVDFNLSGSKSVIPEWSSRSGGKFLHERPDQNSFILEQRQRQLVVVARLEATATNRSRGADDHRERSLPAGGDARGEGRTAGSASDSRRGFALENPNSESVQQRGV